MSTVFNGNAALYPAGYTIPQDSDLITGASVNVALEALGDRTAYLKDHGFIFSTTSATQIDDADLGNTVTATSYTTLTVGNVVVPNARVNDTMFFFVTASYIATGAGQPYFRFLVTQNHGVTPITSNPAGARVKLAAGSSGAFALSAEEYVGNAGNYRVELQAKLGAGSSSVKIHDNFRLSIGQWRANS